MLTPGLKARALRTLQVQREAVGAWRRRLWLRLPPVRRRRRSRALRAWGRGTIAFVCFGNICRSPFAERLTNQHLDFGPRAASAGYFPEEGRRSPDQAVAAADRLGVDLRPHRSRVLTAELVEEADAIFVFDQQNYHTVVRTYPSAKGRVHFIGVLAEKGPLFVPDPVGGAAEDYDLVYQRIAELVAESEAVVTRRPP
jgi:protein-tyrosine phosphatase